MCALDACGQKNTNIGFGIYLVSHQLGNKCHFYDATDDFRLTMNKVSCSRPQAI